MSSRGSLRGDFGSESTADLVHARARRWDATREPFLAHDGRSDPEPFRVSYVFGSAPMENFSPSGAQSGTAPDASQWCPSAQPA